MIDLGCMVPVTRNLDEALRRFRYKHKETVVWVDAVCIDQSNTEERGHQVGIMGKIYRRAENVVAWLGPDPLKKAKRCFDVLSKKHGKQELTPSEAFAMSELMTCEWFSRLWVVQELVLAQNSRFVWGNVGMTTPVLWLSARGYNLATTNADAVWVGKIFSGHTYDLIDLLTWTRRLKCSDDRDRIYAVLGLPYSTSSWFSSEIVQTIERRP